MNTVTIIGDRNGRIWPQVLRTVRESRRNGRGLVLYVPEQYTLQAERDLIADLELPGLLDIQVISPRKLSRLVKERMGSGTRQPMNEYGRLMAVHQVMTEKAEELEFYRNMTDMPGAVKRVGEALNELMESDLSRDELEQYTNRAETGDERAKLNDLRRIWAGYEALTSEQFDDPKTVWTDTVDRLERSGLWDGKDLVVYGFDSIRPDLCELLVKICDHTHSTRVFLTMDREDAPDGRIFIQQHRSIRKLQEALLAAEFREETIYPGEKREGCAEPLQQLDRYLFSMEAASCHGDPGGAIRLFAAASPWEECENIAETLGQWHEEGIEWNRMAVALPAGSDLSGLLRASLQTNGIPFEYQLKERAADHPVCRMLLAALGCLSDGYQTEKVIMIARSGFCTLTPEEGLKLEEYAAAHGIEGRRWQKPFTAGEDAWEAEELRLRLTSPLEELRLELKNAGNAAASVEAVTAFLEKENVWELLQQQEEILLDSELYGKAVLNRHVWKLLMDILEQLWSLLGKRRAAIKDLKHMLSSALTAASEVPLPERHGGVTIGEVGHLLAGETDALILPGVQDGIMTAAGSGWLTDPERKKLEETTGREIGISRENAGLIRRYDYYRTLTLPRKHLIISRSLRSENGGALQADGLIEQIKRLFPDLREEGGLTERGRRAVPVTQRAALNALGPMLTDIKNAREPELPAEWKTMTIQLLHSGTFGNTARRILTELMPEGKRERIRRETAARLFMTDWLSVSRLEQFAACPYRHYIDYGLRPVRQDDFEFRENDAGDFFHEALDRFMKLAGTAEGWPDLAEERVNSLMDGILSELTKEWEDSPLKQDALGEWQGETYKRRIRHAAGVLTRFAANSDFRTIATEQSFGTADGLPPVILTLRDGSHAAIRGKIDRIDTFENGEGIWLRIVDNKSREKRPDASKMASGEQLQLMIYLKAAAESMPRARLAGAMYFPVEDPEVTTPEDNPDAIGEERLKKARMHGLVTAREDVVCAMDRDISPYSVDRVFNQNGSVSKSAGWAVEEETLRGLMNAAVEKAGELCGRMKDGEIKAEPAGEGDASVCRYCEYRGICHVRKTDCRPPEKEISFRDAAAGEQRKNTLRESEK